MRSLVIGVLIFGLCMAEWISPVTFVSAQTPLKPDSAEFLEKIEKLKASFKDSPKVLEEINRLEKKYPEQSGEARYEKSGHQYTTYIVAMMAGLGRPRSFRLAYYSQVPDDEIRFSATLAFFYVFNLDYRKQIMAVLHSLHGGDHDLVLKRRSDLRDLIRDGIKRGSLADYQIGLMIHAFADSYAHTTTHDGQLKAFDYTWGHLFHGHKPDIIAHDPEKYEDYACALYKALSLESACSSKFDPLRDLIKKLEKSRNAELPEFEKYARDPHGFDTDKYEAAGEEREIEREDVEKTINIIEARISR